MDHLFIWFFWLDHSQCYFPIGTEHFISFFGWNTGFCNFYFQGSQGMLVCKWCKVSDWSSIMPPCSLWPQASVGNVIVNGEVTLCNKLYLFQHGLKLVFRNTRYATMWLPLHTRISGGIAPWQCCFISVSYYLLIPRCCTSAHELVLIDWNCESIDSAINWHLRADSSTCSRLLRCL